MNDPGAFPSILILIVRGRKTNRLEGGEEGRLPLTVISEEKVPHLALWQQNESLSDLMDYIDTPAILMTLSIFPSPLSFLSLLPSPWPCSCILPQFKDPEASSQECVYCWTCSGAWFKSIWSYLLLTASVGRLPTSVSCCQDKPRPYTNTPASTWYVENQSVK